MNNAEALSLTMQVATPAAARTNLGVLLVDDEPSMLSELAEAAEDMGFTAYTAPAGDVALELLRSHQDIGVVVSDIRMPGLDGLTLTKRALAGRLESQALEIILITGHATLSDAIDALRSGAFDFVRKPFKQRELFDSVNRAMAKAIGRRAVAAFAETGTNAALAQQGQTLDASGVLRLEAVRGLMHELRTPLVPVFGYADLLEITAPSEAVVTYSREIRRGAQQVLDTMDDLLTLTMLKEGMQHIVKQVMPLAPLLERVREGCRAKAEEKGARLISTNDDQAAVLADKDPLERALSILVGIAITLISREGTVLMSVAGTDSALELLIDAREHGGIDAHQRGNDIIADVKQFAPLGLQVAEKVIAAHGGSLSFASAAGFNVRIGVTLPR